MEKIRISEVAKECAKTPKEALEKALQMGLKVKSVSSSVTQEEAGMLYQFLTTGKNPIPQKEELKTPKKTTKSKDAKEKAPKKTTTKKSTKTQEKAQNESQAAELNTQNTAPQNQTQEITELKMPMPKKGLRIVRKNEQEEKPATTPKSKTSQVLSARELFAQTQDEGYSRTKPKKSHNQTKDRAKAHFSAENGYFGG